MLLEEVARVLDLGLAPRASQGASAPCRSTQGLCSLGLCFPQTMVYLTQYVLFSSCCLSSSRKPPVSGLFFVFLMRMSPLDVPLGQRETAQYSLSWGSGSACAGGIPLWESSPSGLGLVFLEGSRTGPSCAPGQEQFSGARIRTVLDTAPGSITRAGARNSPPPPGIKPKLGSRWFISSCFLIFINHMLYTVNTYLRSQYIFL